MRLLSNETQVTRADAARRSSSTAPTIETVPVENSLLFYDALRRNGVQAEMHVFEHGGHGFGLAPRDPVLAAWTTICESWMRRHGWLTPRR